MRQWLFPRVLLVACLGIATVRIMSTYHVFNQTWDEPAHVAAGMEWLDRGRYTYEPLHPPLARVMVALGPRLAGIRSARYDNVWLEGNSILYAGGRYDRNLALARLGVLPFFLLATLVVFAWAGRLEPATVSACPDCRCRVIAAVALVDLLDAAAPHPRGGELIDLADDAPTLHLYVVDPDTDCEHPRWRDPLSDEWAEAVEEADLSARR